MRRKYVALTLGVVMTGMLLVGCGSSTDNASSADIASSKDASSSSDSTTDAASENTVYGKVTKVDGSTITYEVMERGEKGEKPSGSAMPEGSGAPDGEAPSASGAPDENAKPDGTPPAQPDGSAMPQGSGAPDDNAKRGGGGFTSTGETKTLTVEDDTTIKIVSMKQDSADATDGSISDITEGVMIQIQYTDEDQTTIKEIDISNMGNRSDMKKEDASASASPAADE